MSVSIYNLQLCLLPKERIQADQMTIEISIIISVYNIACELRKCIAGLNAQEIDKCTCELVFVDDGSTDDWIKNLSSLHHQYNVQIFRQQHDGYRLATIRNEGLKRSRGDIVVLLDGDMIPPQNWLAAHAAEFTEEKRQFAVSIGHRCFIDTSHIPSALLDNNISLIESLPEICSSSNWYATGDRRLQELQGLENHPAPYNLCHGCNLAFPRKLAFNAGLFDEAFNGHWGYEDIEFAYRLHKCGANFRWTPSALAFHQENHALTYNDRVLVYCVTDK